MKDFTFNNEVLCSQVGSKSEIANARSTHFNSQGMQSEMLSETSPQWSEIQIQDGRGQRQTGHQS